MPPFVHRGSLRRGGKDGEAGWEDEAERRDMGVNFKQPIKRETTKEG